MQFYTLWSALREVVLLPVPDSITWRWTTSGKYTVASAYKCQFQGTNAPFSTSKFWGAQAEPKCRFFAWLALHGKLLTADNLAIRGWPHDPICRLCMIHPETTQHLLLDCTFATAVREKVFAANGTLGMVQPPMGRNLNTWWDDLLRGLPKEKRKEASGALIYAMWGTWKERNRRVFRNIGVLSDAVVALVREEIAQWAYTHSIDLGD